MLRNKVTLNLCDILLAAGNQEDEILHKCQCYYIAEAICYTHRKAVEDLFTDSSPNIPGQTGSWVTLVDWPELPSVCLLAQQKTPYYGLSPILENEGTISSIYNVINTIFSYQLEYNQEKDFDQQLQIVYSCK